MCATRELIISLVSASSISKRKLASNITSLSTHKQKTKNKFFFCEKSIARIYQIDFTTDEKLKTPYDFPVFPYKGCESSMVQFFAIKNIVSFRVSTLCMFYIHIYACNIVVVGMKMYLLSVSSFAKSLRKNPSLKQFIVLGL